MIPFFLLGTVQAQDTVVEWFFQSESRIVTGGTDANSNAEISREDGFSGAYNFFGDTELTTNSWDGEQNENFWVINFSTQGFDDLKLSSKQEGSGSSPADFMIQYSLDGTTWTDVPNSSIVVGSDDFTSGVLENLDLPDALDNQDDVYLRWVNTSNTSINGGDVASGGNSRIIDIVVSSGDYIAPTPDFTEVANIGELLQNASQGDLLEITGEVIVTYYAGGFRNQFYIQDDTGAILIDDNGGTITTSFVEGDGITGLQGEFSSFSGTNQFVPSEDPGVPSSQDNDLPVVDLTLSELDADNQSQLVRVTGASFEGINSGDQFESSANYDIVDGSFTEGETATFRTSFGGADYIGSTIPSQEFELIAIASQFNGSPQLTARSLDDFIFNESFASLQIIHNSPDPAVDSVDVFVNGGSFLTDVAFRTATAFTQVPAGVELSIEIAPAGAGIGAALAPIPVTLTEGENYIAVASGVLDPSQFTDADGNAFSLEVFSGAKTEADDGTTVDLLVQHGSPDAPNVDIYLEQTGSDSPAISDIGYPEFVGYTPIAPENEFIGIAGAGGDLITQFSAPLADLEAAGASVTVLASGFFNGANASEDNGFGLIAVLADGTTLLLEEFSLTQSIGYANLQFPPNASITSVETADVYGQVYAQGITETDGAAEGMSAWVGVSSTDTNPATWDEESWMEASFNVQSGNNDEYVAAIGNGLAPGTYYYATRFRYDNEEYVYGGYTEQGGGFWEENVNVSGELTLTIGAATIAEARAANEGSFLEVTAVVSSNDFGFGVADYFVQDNTAGINITDFDAGGNRNGVVVQPGDSIRIVGETAVFNNQKNIEVSEFEILSSDNALPDPQIVTADEYNAESALQGSRVILQNVTLTEASESDWPTDAVNSGSGVNVTFENAAGETFIVRIARNNSFYSPGSPVPDGPVNITGSLGQFGDDTQLFPFFEGDIAPVPTQVQIIHNSPDPAVSSVDIYVDGTLTLEDVAFRSATGFIELPSNTGLDIGVTPTGQPLSSGITVQNVFFDPGNYYVVASGVLDPSGFAANPSGEDIDFFLDVIPNATTSAPDEDTFSFRINHGSPDAPAVDIFARGVATLAEGVVFGTTTADYTNVPAASYTIDIAPAGDEIIASFEADANALGGESALVLASGFLTPSANQDGEAFGALLVLADGTTALLPGVSTSIDEISGMPQEFALEQNYPNPFNPTTQIEYALPEAASVQIAVFNIVGQRVATLLNNEQQPAGSYSVSFDASNLASGMYLYRIQAGNFIQTRKMTLIK